MLERDFLGEARARRKIAQVNILQVTQPQKPEEPELDEKYVRAKCESLLTEAENNYWENIPEEIKQFYTQVINEIINRESVDIFGKLLERRPLVCLKESRSFIHPDLPRQKRLADLEINDASDWVVGVKCVAGQTMTIPGECEKEIAFGTPGTVTVNRPDRTRIFRFGFQYSFLDPKRPSQGGVGSFFIGDGEKIFMETAEASKQPKNLYSKDFSQDAPKGFIYHFRYPEEFEKAVDAITTAVDANEHTYLVPLEYKATF